VEIEILVLRHRLNVLRRKFPKRLALSSMTACCLLGFIASGVLDSLKIIRLETLLRWHPAGFRAYWRWKSRPRGGRPTTPADIGRLIREMSVCQTRFGARPAYTANYSSSASMSDRPRRKVPGSEKALAIPSMEDAFFEITYGFPILRHSRREILCVTAHPSVQWIIRQLTEAYGWQKALGYIVLDRGCIYGEVFIHCLRAGTASRRDLFVAPHDLVPAVVGGHAMTGRTFGRLISSIRRHCMDHVVVFGERHGRLHYQYARV
jgi:hypothetical protein